MSHSATITTHADKNVGPFHEGDTLLVYEYFLTVQGEEPFTGTPAVFLRLGGCNRGSKRDCKFCDTAFEFKNSTWWSIDDLIDKLVDLLLTIKGRRPLLVVTGGEPALQLRALRVFLEHIDKRWSEVDGRQLDIQFETNGDYDLTPILNDNKQYELTNLFIVVSPKEPYTKKKLWFVNAHMSVLKTSVYIRRVVCAEEQSAYHGLPKWLTPNLIILNKSRIFVSPQTVYQADGTINREATLENVRHAIKLATDYGLRVSFQAHAYIGVR